jgi:hypothetical protein
MPCRGTIHLVVDQQDLLSLRAWVNMQDPTIQVHALEIPEELSFLSGYIAQAWVMMWADKFVNTHHGMAADFMLFLDTDSPLGLPVTCGSLFDEQGKLYIAGWDMHSTQPQFERGVEDMVGHVKSSYMSYFPFIMPVGAFARMRRHIAGRMNATNFNEAFVNWSRLPGVNVNQFSQFAVMGAYLELYEQEIVHPIFCPVFGEHKGSACSQWVPPGTHLGWRPCAYVNGCLTGGVAIYRSNGTQEFDQYSNKFAPSTVNVIENLFVDGVCFQHYLNTGTILDGCTANQSMTVNAELLPYPKDPPSITRLQEIYQKDPDTGHLCSSVTAEEARKQS